jgi:RNA polymerase sigma-70 factor (ECF subfamily)
LRVLRARERYTPTARFSTFLYRVAFNLAVNHTERSKSSRSLDEGASQGTGSPADNAVAEDGDPVRHMETVDVVFAVRQAIASLPETQRMALILAKYEEQSFAEIAEVLGSTEKAVKSLVHRARENLRERLKPFLEKELA